jgi:Acyl-CoA carboxylase epsilon subunit
MSDQAGRPTLRVIRGDAGPEEIAALLAVITARSAAAVAAAERPAGSAWADRGALMRQPPRPGPGAWRASSWQR